MNKALAIITYSRFSYLELVLPSILNQKVHGKSIYEVYDLYVFQDGLWAGETEENQIGHKKIAKYLDRLPDNISVIRQAENIGVALHFDFIERLFFKEKKYDFGVFCEDDLILAPGYMQVLDLMEQKFRNDHRVGLMSAYPNNPLRSIADQKANQSRYLQMGHNWAFGMTNAFWQRRQPMVDIYLDIIRGFPYRKRPTGKVLEWLEKMGFRPDASSQDYIKKCATLALGSARVATFANYGLPIGRTGLHFSPEQFEKYRLDRVVVFNEVLTSLGELDDTQWKDIYMKDAAEVGENFSKNIATNIPFFQEKLKNGEFTASKIIPESSKITQNNMPAAVSKSYTIPNRPSMESEGVALLESHLRKATSYLEYGSGGSTVMAMEMGIPQIFTVDSDAQFLKAVVGKISAFNNKAVKVNAFHADIGVTKEWGQPMDTTSATKWPNYCIAPWKEILRGGIKPDLILIDGRFRVASFLASLVFAKKGSVILFDDYCNRDIYHGVEKHLKPVKKIGRMAEFVVDDSFLIEPVLLDLIPASTNPA